MGCCSLVRKRSFGRGYDDKVDEDHVEVLGTWDFKWPLGSRIRVAFQRPGSEDVSERDFLATVDIIKGLADSWLTPDEKGAKANISFDWTKLVFESADDTDPQNGSHFDEPEDTPGYRERDYDVLVSLDALPLSKRDPRTLGRTQRIFLPGAELGTFARRVDYAVPTIYIGPFPAFSSNLPEYYRTNPIARYYVLHEFGHVLGLAHTHQSPIRRQALEKSHPKIARDLKEISRSAANLLQLRATIESGGEGLAAAVALEPEARKELRERLAKTKSVLKDFLLAHQIPLTLNEVELDDFIIGQIVDVWPGNVRFSDWPDGPEKSMMDVPAFDCMIGIHDADPKCPLCAKLVTRSEPYPHDRAFLRTLYPLSEGVNNSEAAERAPKR